MIFLTESRCPEFSRWTCLFGQLNRVLWWAPCASSEFALIGGSNIPFLDLSFFPFSGRFAASRTDRVFFDPP